MQNINHFDDMIADMLSNKKRNPMITELFIRVRKLNIPLVFITQSYFAAREYITLNSTHYSIMKIPDKGQLQQAAFNHLSDNDFQNFINLCKKCTAKPYSFLVIDATLGSDNSLRFRKNLLKRILKLIKATENKIREEKLQYDINREDIYEYRADKYEYLTDEEILPSNQRQIIEQTKFAYSPLGKAFKKQTKTIEYQGGKQIRAIEDNKKQLDNNKFLLSKERENLRLFTAKYLVK